MKKTDKKKLQKIELVSKTPIGPRELFIDGVKVENVAHVELESVYGSPQCLNVSILLTKGSEFSVRVDDESN